MDDTCTITYDSSGTRDDVLDDVTGALVAPDPDTVTVYDDTTVGDGGRDLGARCKVSPLRIDPSRSQEGGLDVQSRAYQGSLPWDAPAPEEGALLTVTSSRRDPDLVGKEFIVRGVGFSTFLVSRRLVLELR